MSIETTRWYGEELMQMSAEEEAVNKREHLYVNASIEDLISCGDDRDIDYLAVQMFGAVAHITHNRVIVAEVLHPGASTNLTFDSEIKKDVVELKSFGINASVHSDDTNEGGKEFQLTIEDGDVGCAYINLRQLISRKIYEDKDAIIESVAIRFPELFQSPEDYAYARSVVDANGRLAGNDAYFKAGGRKTALAAARAGAPAVVVKGQHASNADGIINETIDSTLDTKQAVKENLPAYNHDKWAVDKINDLKGAHNKRLQQIAEIIDVEGVFRALVVKTVGRR